MADENLNITVTADSSRGVAALEEAIAILQSTRGELASTGEAAKVSSVAMVGGAEASAAAYQEMGATIAASAASFQASAASMAASVQGLTTTHVAHAAAAARSAESVRSLEAPTNAAARAMRGMGVEAGAVAERLFAMNEAVDALAGGPLGIIAAALIAIGTAVSVFRQAADSAGEMQSNMISLDAAVKAAGGSVAAANEKVKDFNESAEAIGFAANQADEALNRLVTSGMSVHDAMTVTSVAMEVARAKHVDLIDVVGRLQEAEAGRGIGLVQLDSNLKPLIQHHGDMDSILRVLSADMAGQAVDAANSYQGALARLHAEWERSMDQLGGDVLPGMTHLVNALIGVVMTLPEVESAWAQTFNGIAEIAHASVDAVVSEMQRLAHALDPMIAGPAHASDPGKLFDKGIADVEKGNERYKAATTKSMHDYAQIAVDAERQFHAPSHINLDKDFNVGNVPKGRGAGGTSEAGNLPLPIDQDEAAKTDVVVASQERLKASLQALDDSELKYKNDLGLATTEQQKNAAEVALKLHVVDDAYTASRLITAQLAAENAEVKKLTAAHSDSKDVMDGVGTAYNNLLAKTQAQGKATKSQAADLDVLKKTYDNAKKTFDQAGSTIQTLKQQIDENTHSLAEHRAKVEEVAEATAKLNLAYNEAIAKSKETLEADEATYKVGLAQQKAYWQSKLDALEQGNAKLEMQLDMDQSVLEALQKEHQTKMVAGLVDQWKAIVAAEQLGIAQSLKQKAEYLAKEDALDTKRSDQAKDVAINAQKNQDDLATYDRSIQQQIAYYQKRLAIIVSSGNDEYDEQVELEKKIQDLQTKAAEDAIARQKELADKIADTMSKMVDDVVFKHKSMRAELKEVWQGIVDDFIASQLKKLVEGILLPSGGLPGTSPAGGSGQNPGGIVGGFLQKMGINVGMIDGAGAGAIAGTNSVPLPQAITESTRATVTLDDNLKTLTTAVQDLTSTLRSSSGAATGFSSSQATPSAFAAFQGGGGGSGGLIQDQGIITAAIAAASSYGILGALIGTSGASSVISALPSGSAGTSQPSIYAPNQPIQPNNTAQANGILAIPGGYPTGTEFEKPLFSGAAWHVYNIYVGASGAPSASYPSIGGGGTTSAQSSALSNAMLGSPGALGGSGSSSVFGDTSSSGGSGGIFGSSSAAAALASSSVGASGGGYTASQMLGFAARGVGASGGALGSGGNLGSLFTLGGQTSGNLLSIGGSKLPIASVAGAALEGYTIGSLDSSLFNNGQNDAATGGAIGGAVGDVAGFAIAGPVGATVGGFVGSVLGSAVGALFGSHDKPANMPDKYDTVRYGTIIADLIGHAGANGTTFYEESQVSQVTGGMTGLAFVEMVLAKYGTKENAPPWLQGYWDTLVSMFGISSSGSGKLQFQHDIGQISVSGAQGAGQVYSYLDYGQALSTFLQAYSQNEGDAAPPAADYNLSRGEGGAASLSYTGMTNTTFGTTTPGSSPGVPINPGSLGFGLGSSGGGGSGGGTGSHTKGGGSSYKLGVGGLPAGGGGVHVVGGGGGAPIVYLDFRGAQIIGPGGLDEVAVDMSQALERVASGQVAGASRSIGNAGGPRYKSAF